MRLAFWWRLPPLGLAEVAQHAGQPLPARGHARTPPGPADPRALAEDRPAPARRLPVEVLELLKGRAGRVRRDARVEDSRATYPTVNDVQRTFGVSWDELVELEPLLETLLERVRLAGAGGRIFTDVDRVFGPLRNELAALIGFAGRHHRHPVLGSVGAYEVAYWKLYDAVVRLLSGRNASAQEAPAR
jgi:hypothetical protein